jgi:small-conductance mechanosensitive channel
MEEVTSAHQAMAKELRANLSKGHADLGASVASQLQELDRAHSAMARQQQERLAKVHGDLDRAEARRKASVKSWMEEVAGAHAAAREEWQNLTATMQAKRAGVAVAEALPEVAPPPPAVEEAVPAAPVAEAAEEEEEAAEVGEVTEELASLGRRFFEYLANHPAGTRLTELEHGFGLGRFQAARVIRHLMNEGKAKKQGLLYFAT